MYKINKLVEVVLKQFFMSPTYGLA